MLPALVPSAPAKLIVTEVKRTGFSVRWLPPEEDGGSPVTSYDVDLLAVTKAAVTEDIPGDWSRVSQVLFCSPFWRLLEPD